MNKKILLLCFGLVGSLVLTGCSPSLQDTPPFTDNFDNQIHEYLTLTDEEIGLQLDRPTAWGELKTSKDADFIIFSLPYYDVNYEAETTREIVRLHFIEIDTYHTLPEGDYQGIESFKEKTIGHNDTYYFILWMGIFQPGEFESLTFGASSGIVYEYLVNTGFTIFPTKEIYTRIESPESIESGLLYRNEEHGFQMILPKEFKEIKIYTKYSNTDTFSRGEYDFIVFSLPQSEKSRINRFLPKELGYYNDFLRIICIPADKYPLITQRDMGGRGYLEEITWGYNDSYYFVGAFGNMGWDGFQYLMPRYNEEKYKADSDCEFVDYLGEKVSGIGCRLDNVVKGGFSVFDV